MHIKWEEKWARYEIDVEIFYSRILVAISRDRREIDSKLILGYLACKSFSLVNMLIKYSFFYRSQRLIMYDLCSE